MSSHRPFQRAQVQPTVNCERARPWPCLCPAFRVLRNSLTIIAYAVVPCSFPLEAPVNPGPVTPLSLPLCAALTSAVLCRKAHWVPGACLRAEQAADVIWRHVMQRVRAVRLGAVDPGVKLGAVGWAVRPSGKVLIHHEHKVGRFDVDLLLRMIVWRRRRRRLGGTVCACPVGQAP